MIVDTSALTAIMLCEPGYQRLVEVLEAEPGCIMAAGTLVESVTVAIRKRGPGGPAELFTIVDGLGITVVPTIAADAEVAAEAYARFGKGQGHPAQLNFGDCFTYALAERTGRAIFCVGDDFAAADLPVFPLPLLTPQEAP